ncbi:GGDEF domain-containing protein [Allochromatium palmeri]|uniref:diguanylate cyclase n=1 Tax=Allochromatium palmeri TaxID=231048 RepID=A0A6N8EFV2_9GAMM|nr:GGDEF domain-containing protein [Allochromatium palmeri]MTW21709.1 diguanylate cyclase [Allochromatium palmeri]
MVKFWKRESGAAPQETANTTPVNPSDPATLAALEQAALDQLASVLRTWGKYAFDLDEIKAATLAEQLERWSMHVLTAASPEATRDAKESEATASTRRDWGGLRDFVTRIRRSEQSYVSRQVLGTRQVMGEFVQTLGLALAEDQEEQTKVMEVINQLRSTIENNAPIEVLSREAMNAIDLIASIARDRAQRNQGLLNELTGKLQSLRGELDAAQREIDLDGLTRVYNRKAFDKQLARVFELCKLSGESACLLMIDADHFKQVNDEYGHPAGDVVLKRLANCCSKGFPRKSDFVARYGGEEFAVILQDTPLKTAWQLAQRLLDSVRVMRIDHDGQELGITISIGLAELGALPSPEHWLKTSDSALYTAKNSGRDQVVSVPDLNEQR